MTPYEGDDEGESGAIIHIRIELDGSIHHAREAAAQGKTKAHARRGVRSLARGFVERLEKTPCLFSRNAGLRGQTLG